jgi:ATP-dependent DNA helicase RecG
MNEPELLSRIDRWEDLHTEFKEAFDADRELAKDLVCFANTDGGQLIFGVTEGRMITGIGDVSSLVRKVEEVAFDKCEPPISVLQETVEHEGHTVVIVNVPKGDERPYRTSSGQVYTRTSFGCRQVSLEELRRLVFVSGSRYYDESPLPRLSLADLDYEAVERYLAETGQSDLAVDIDRLLQNWRMTDDTHPTVAGLIVFGRQPQFHLPYAQINAARFPGTDIADDLLDSTDLTGRLFDVIAGAERFLDVSLRTPHRIRGFEREDHPELPQPALREAIVNAVAHRDYTVTGPVRLFVLSDRVEVHAPGRVPNTVDADMMRAGTHVVRNAHIYARLADVSGLVSRAGSGVRRMSRLAREATGRDIGIELRANEVVFTLPRPTDEFLAARSS